jgi:TatD-related deoxyribonuclease
VLLIPVAERFGLDKAEKMLIRGMEDAASLVADGKANALGEIGRPHFPVDDPKIIESSNRILLRGMELAHDVDCPVIIHCESESYTDESLASIANEAGLDPGMVVKHSSPPWVTPEETYGVMPSIPASRSLIREALSKGSRFMIETDFIDDPNKPNAIMAVTSVPKRINGLHQSGELSEEQIHRMCVDIPNNLYDRH